MYIVQKLFCLDKSDRQGILRLVVQSQINQVFQVGWWGKVGLEHSFMWLKIHFCELENSRLFTEFQCLQAGLYFQVHRCNFLHIFAGVSMYCIFVFIFQFILLCTGNFSIHLLFQHLLAEFYMYVYMYCMYLYLFSSSYFCALK